MRDKLRSPGSISTLIAAPPIDSESVAAGVSKWFAEVGLNSAAEFGGGAGETQSRDHPHCESQAPEIHRRIFRARGEATRAASPRVGRFDRQPLLA